VQILQLVAVVVRLAQIQDLTVGQAVAVVVLMEVHLRML
jgi:hypothetical protein